jgi:hypothetical protein
MTATGRKADDRFWPKPEWQLWSKHRGKLPFSEIL